MNTAHDRKALEEADLKRIIDLTPADRDWPYESGYRAAREFLDSWSWREYVAERQAVTTER